MRFDEAHTERFPAVARIVCEPTKTRRRVAGRSTRNVMALAAPLPGKLLASYPVLADALIRQGNRNGQKNKAYAQTLQIHQSCADLAFRICPNQAGRQPTFVIERRSRCRSIFLLSRPACRPRKIAGRSFLGLQGACQSRCRAAGGKRWPL